MKKNPPLIDFFLIGPVSLPEFNTRFHTTAASLRRQGFTVASPIENAPDSAPNFVQLLRYSLPLLCACRRVVLLSDHARCPLAKFLVYIAQRLQLDFFDVTTMGQIPGMELRISFSEAVGGDPRRARNLLNELASELAG